MSLLTTRSVVLCAGPVQAQVRVRRRRSVIHSLILLPAFILCLYFCLSASLQVACFCLYSRLRWLLALSTACNCWIEHSVCTQSLSLSSPIMRSGVAAQIQRGPAQRVARTHCRGACIVLFDVLSYRAILSVWLCSSLAGLDGWLGGFFRVWRPSLQLITTCLSLLSIVPTHSWRRRASRSRR
jgi:hypothetical protein